MAITPSVDCPRGSRATTWGRPPPLSGPPSKVGRGGRLVEGKDYGLAAITTAGENLVLCSGIMAGPKAIYARGGPGAKMGSLNLKAILIQGRTADLTPARTAGGVLDLLERVVGAALTAAR